MLIIDNVSKSYRHHHVLSHISFAVQQGEIIGLVGRNGAGKTTLLHIIATLLPQDEGTITLYDETERKKLRQHIGFVPQELAIFEDMTVKENMLFFANLNPVKKTQTQLRALCEKVSLHVWDEPVRKLSGGMKRKLNLALSLIHDPTLLLLDEPTVGIDLKSKLEIAKTLQHLAEENVMIIYISHDMDEIKNMCHRILSIGDDDFYYDLLQETTHIEKI